MESVGAAVWAVGMTKKKLVMKEFLFTRAKFIMESIRDMFENTKRVKGSKYGLTKKSKEQSDDANDESDMASSMETFMEVLPKELDEFECKINATESIHTFLCREDKPSFDTRISVCPTCAKRLLTSTMAVHQHEMHSGSIVEEADGAHDKSCILAAAGK